jgi:hypothetical protein
MGEIRNTYKILVGEPEGRCLSEVVGVGGRLILEWVLGKLGLGVWTRFIWFRIGTGGGLYC